jgi:hypothetical protein
MEKDAQIENFKQLFLEDKTTQQMNYEIAQMYKEQEHGSLL